MSLRKWIIMALVLQSIMCILRLVLYLDVIGSFIMLIMVVLGWYALKEEMNITYVCCWGVLSLLNGVFDAVRLIDLVVTESDAFFDSSYGFMYNVKNAVYIVIPLSSLVGCVISFLLYKDYEAQELPGPGTGNVEEIRPLLANDRGTIERANDRANDSVNDGASDPATPANYGNFSTPENVRPPHDSWGGRGHRLTDD